MKFYYRRSLASIISAAFLSVTIAGFAEEPFPSKTDGKAAQTEDVKMQKLIEKINRQISSQEKTIQSLKAEVNSLKTAQKNTTKSLAATEKKSSQTFTQSSKITNAHNRLIDLGASPVITAPYLGVPSRWDATDLIVNQPAYNEDILLMTRDVAMDKAASDLGFPTPANPFIELSGKLEAQAFNTKPFNGSSQNNVNVSAAEIDFAAHVSDWVNGLIDLNYDNLAPNANNINTNAELISNSRVYVSQAFLTIGNLKKSPFYTTLGVRYLPYGHYLSYMISNPYTENLFRTKDPSLTIGYHPMVGKLGPYVTAFAFKGDTSIGSTSNKINNYGADLGYIFDLKKINGDVGISAIANIADALGIQANGITSADQFQGFGFTSETLQKRVPGANIHFQFGTGPYTLIAEGNMATSRFATQDMTYNGQGAKPAAAHVEGVYSFLLGKYPSSLAIGYDHSWQALALASPETRYITTLSTSLFKDTIEDLEFKHEINYSANDTASGQNLPVILPGHYSNTITAQIGYYF